ncbi:DUF771 domain-containing protein [Bacillus thuringiensis]|uniref:DUF771 domain-containing protein n=1 Tax=Bacillus thuringiensis TaxID=1428 RepID=A0A9X6TIR3_BACTU|nr:DUF771 domain-containing protein [Bacillus thuringiensis]PEA87053.1 hypothetical protein CON71_27280 [Bacillus thuringiensis]
MLGNAIEITISEEQLKPLVNAEVKRIIEEKEEVGTIWNMERLCKEWSRSDEWIKNNELYEMKDKGIAIKDGNRWTFDAKAAKEYISDWFRKRVLQQMDQK